jgi:hypothetical protein
MAFSEKPPNPFPSNAQVVGPDGKMTQEFIAWLNRVLQYLERMRASIP